MSSGNRGDIVILATPLAFRGLHFAYAIEKGLNVFMEKPLTADGPSSKRMLELAKKADEKNLKCAVGLMIRHCRGRQELHKRIADGEIGDIIAMRAYRMNCAIMASFMLGKGNRSRGSVLLSRGRGAWQGRGGKEIGRPGVMLAATPLPREVKVETRSGLP